MRLQHFALFTDGWGFASAAREKELDGEEPGEVKKKKEKSRAEI